VDVRTDVRTHLKSTRSSPGDDLKIKPFK